MAVRTGGKWFWHMDTNADRAPQRDTYRERERGRETIRSSIVCQWYTFTSSTHNLAFRDNTLPLLSPSVPPSILPGPIKVKFLPSSQGAHLHPAGKHPVRACSKGLLIQSDCSSARPYRHGHRHLWEPHHRASWGCWLWLVETESQREVCITTLQRGLDLARSDSPRTAKA